MTLSRPSVAALINREFVPVWETVRPVPKVTIQFGDGRTLERTLAGNTVMSVCLPDGRVLDSLPGVYTAAALEKELQEVLSLYRSLQTACAPEDVPARVVAWHRERVTAAVRSEAARITFSKAMVESPLLKALGINRQQTMALLKAASGAETAPGPGETEPAVAAPTPAAPTARTDARAAAAIPRSAGAVPGFPTTRRAPAAEAEPALPPPPNILADPKAAFELLAARIEDVSKAPASVGQLRSQVAGQAATPKASPEVSGQEAVEFDSRTNVQLVRPAVHLLFTLYTGLPDARRARDDVYKRVLHVPVDDPYLGLADVLVPGTPPGK